MKICAIHQPNFCAWLPYFLKIAKADVFVILTEAQFSKSYYQHRFNIDERLFTMPTVNGDIPIKDKKYLEPGKNWLKIKRSLAGIYNGHGYGSALDRFDGCLSESLCDTNVSIIFRACETFGIDTTKICTDYPTNLTQNDRNIDICKHYDCDAYLSGSGAQTYNDEAAFKSAGIQLVYQELPTSDKIPLVEAIRQERRLA